MAGALLTPIDMDDEQDDPCDCFDPENPTPASPKRGGSGEPPDREPGVLQVQLMGQSGEDKEGNPILKAIGVTPEGRMMADINELPTGYTGTLTNDNIRLTFQNGRLVTVSFTGSGGWGSA